MASMFMLNPSPRSAYERKPRQATHEIVYHYRGLIERGPRYEWREGYSEQGEHGPFYPWMTRGECRKDARVQGGKAVFYRNGVKEK